MQAATALLLLWGLVLLVKKSKPNMRPLSTKEQHKGDPSKPVPDETRRVNTRDDPSSYEQSPADLLQLYPNPVQQ